MRQFHIDAYTMQISIEDELAADYSSLEPEGAYGPLNLIKAGGSAEAPAACHANAKAKQGPWQPLRHALLRLTRALLAALADQPPVSSAPGASGDAGTASSPSGSQQQAGLAAGTAAAGGAAAEAEADRASTRALAEESCDLAHSLMGAPCSAQS